MRVLLVEDDRMIGEAIESSLRQAAYAADWVRDGASAIAALDGHQYELVLLDLGIPRRNGHEVLAHVRARHDPVPVLIVSACDALDERLLGLNGGADDYILKPFDMAELLARMRAVIRRRAGAPESIMSNGELSLDLASREASFSGTTTTLTAREFSLLQALLMRPGAILSRHELEDRIYGWNEEVESNAVEFIIHAVRKKLGNAVIKNVRGVGWTVSRQA